MKSLFIERHDQSLVVFHEVDMPLAQRNEAIVAVYASSINRGELGWQGG